MAEHDPAQATAALPSGTVLVHRPDKGSGRVMAYAYDNAGKILARHVSASYKTFRCDMGICECAEQHGWIKREMYAARYPDGYTIEEYIGDPAGHPQLKRWVMA